MQGKKLFTENPMGASEVVSQQDNKQLEVGDQEKLS